MAKKLPAEIRIEPIEKGGFVVHHNANQMGAGPYKEPKKFAFDNQKDMVEHIKKMTVTKKPRNFREALDNLKKR